MPNLESENTRVTNLRRHERFLCFDGCVMRLAIRPEFRCRRALLLNVSSGGLGFLLDMPLETGTVLAMELGNTEEETKGLVARVVHSRPHPIPAEAPWLPRPSRLARLVRWVL